MGMRKKNNSFRFRKFEIIHGHSFQKVGTDSVLLGAWVTWPYEGKPSQILDIGTGTGLLALMMAQRFPGAQIHAVEPDKNAFAEAVRNVNHSPFAGSIRVYHTRLQDFSPSVKYDLIVSNPPFFPDDMNSERKQARSNLFLSPDAIFSFATSFGKANGLVALVYPSDLDREMLDAAYMHGYFPAARTFYRHDPFSPYKRTLWRFSRDYKRTFQENKLTLYDENGRKTSAYCELTKDFYL